MNNPQTYNKLIVALVGFLVVVAHNAGVEIAEDVSSSLIALLTAAAVYAIPNK